MLPHFCLVWQLFNSTAKYPVCQHLKTQNIDFLQFFWQDFLFSAVIMEKPHIAASACRLPLFHSLPAEKAIQVISQKSRKANDHRSISNVISARHHPQNYENNIIRRSIAQKIKGGDRETAPKNKTSIRDIKLPSRLSLFLMSISCASRRIETFRKIIEFAAASVVWEIAISATITKLLQKLQIFRISAFTILGIHMPLCL